MNTTFTAKGRKVLVLLSDASFETSAQKIMESLKKEGCVCETAMPKLSDSKKLNIDYQIEAPDSVLYDGLVVLSGKDPDPMFKKKATDFLNDAFSHFKTIAPLGDSANWIDSWKVKEPGVLDKNTVGNMAQEIAKHRHWERKIAK